MARLATSCKALTCRIATPLPQPPVGCAPAFQISCAYSMGLPWRGHFVGRLISHRAVRSNTRRDGVGRGARRIQTGSVASGDSARGMGSIDRYIFRTTFGAFLVVLI